MLLDGRRLEADHTPQAVRDRLQQTPSPSCLRDFIYGAVDGAVVGGVAAALAYGAGAVFQGLA